MTIATFNVKNKTASRLLRLKPTELERFEMNASLINEADPDVIGLQEVTKRQLEYLKEKFADRYRIIGEFRRSPGVTDEACPIMIKKDYEIITDTNIFSLSDDIYKVGKKYVGAMFPRICTDIFVDDGMDLYHISNVHVDNSTIAQRKTFSENGALEKILYRKENSSEISIILGDFNSEIKGELKYFCQRNFMDDALESLGKTYKPLNLAIDHILCSDNANYDDAYALSNAGSDHCLIMTDISPRRS